jgi:two-component system sensor histidine kinase KdpD
VTSLLQQDVDWTARGGAEFLATIHEETDRLDALVGNLLDMSRLQTGASSSTRSPSGSTRSFPPSCAVLGDRGTDVRLDFRTMCPA